MNHYYTDEFFKDRIWMGKGECAPFTVMKTIKFKYSSEDPLGKI